MKNQPRSSSFQTLKFFGQAVLSFFLTWNTAFATQDIPELIIQNNRYSPETLTVEAGKRFKIKISNKDATSEEFESKSMIIEKFIAPGKSITLTLGPLKPGEYDFFGCFHRNTAKGKILAVKKD